jgi:hypothetical protein
MTKRTFELTLTLRARLELEQAVIDAVDDEWRSRFYDLETPEDIAEMIGNCMVVYHWKLSSLDGFADQPDHYARIDSLEGGCHRVTEVTDDAG